ncbi:hypothetical protein [Krasilnikovia sp. MM14-A1259]|uniref:hypothetical protein n=1 Tax=Krasilnikovia sp. MM14-A1259 TaxID=3373539 RepID=UPI003812510A
MEANQFTTSDRVRALLERRYLTMTYLARLWRTRVEVTMWDGRRRTGRLSSAVLSADPAPTGKAAVAVHPWGVILV